MARLLCSRLMSGYNPGVLEATNSPEPAQPAHRAAKAFVFAPVVLLLFGCGASDQKLYEMFQHEDPGVRVRAARLAGDRKDVGAAPYLVDRLTDSEPEVRFVAILALEKITGDRMGYDYFAPPTDRAEAVRHWRKWLADRGHPSAATHPAKADVQ